jgi:hypothetical protein
MDQSLKDKDDREQAEKSGSKETRHREPTPPPDNVDPVVTIIKDPPGSDS